MIKLKSFKRLLCFILTTILVASAAQIPYAQALTKEDEIAAIKEKQSALDKKIDAASDKIAALKDDIEQQEEYAAELQEQINDMQEQIYLLDSEILLLQGQIDEFQALIDEKQEIVNNLQKEIDELEKNIANCEKEIEETKELLKKRLKALYVNGETSELELFLSAGSLADFLTRLELMSSVTKRDNELIISIRDAIIKIEDDKLKLEDNQEQIEAARELLAQEQEKLKLSQDEIQSAKDKAEERRSNIQSNWNSVQSIINNLDSQSKAYKNSISSMEKEKKAFEDRMDSLINQSLPNIKADTSNLGFIWPMENCNRSNSISSIYGVKRSNGTHKGLDISPSGAKGRKIYAAAGGKVTIATYHFSYGNYVVIDHGNGVATTYAHCSKLYVSVGDKVSQGQTIALCGNTGNSTGHHLHFEVRLSTGNGKYERVNPLLYLP